MYCICNEDYTVKTEYSAITRWDGDNNLTHDLEPVKNLKNNLHYSFNQLLLMRLTIKKPLKI